MMFFFLIIVIDIVHYAITRYYAMPPCRHAIIISRRFRCRFRCHAIDFIDISFAAVVAYHYLFSLSDTPLSEVSSPCQTLAGHSFRGSSIDEPGFFAAAFAATLAAIERQISVFSH
jgi:hypothetical protein